MHHQLGEEFAKTTALTVRSYLECNELLPSPLPPPTPDPIRFQRLDHCFVRSQWLPSVLSCRSKLKMGYPSDHYPLVVEVRAKLKAKPRQPPAYSKFAAPGEHQVALYRSLVSQKPTAAVSSDTTSPTDRSTYTFFTDGSGTKGKCASATPAGWGWTRTGWIRAAL